MAENVRSVCESGSIGVIEFPLLFCVRRALQLALRSPSVTDSRQVCQCSWGVHDLSAGEQPGRPEAANRFDFLKNRAQSPAGNIVHAVTWCKHVDGPEM
ncbi:unnamed protein product [Dicrocoelium dendriticum]|nr:unnamed protein product [Dicrocoelium dendriticum]